MTKLQERSVGGFEAGGGVKIIFQFQMAESLADIGDLDLGKIESEQVLSQLECPVCYDYIIPPVRQCK